MVIAHNLMAMNAQRQFNIVGGTKNKSSEKLSSGYRINRAADDAAGLSISEGMRRQIRGLTQGVRNAQDGVSLCQVADGALAEVNDMLHRITELSVQSANGVYSEKDRTSIQEEISEILLEIDRISDDTKFNSLQVFGGGTQYITPTVGTLEVHGIPTDTTAMTYNIMADSAGFSINGDSFSWSAFQSGGNTLADQDIAAGTYTFDYHGFTLSLKADDNASMQDLTGRLNGASFSTRIPGISSKQNLIEAEVSGSIDLFSVNIAFAPSYLKATEEGIMFCLGSGGPSNPTLLNALESVPDNNSKWKTDWDTAVDGTEITQTIKFSGDNGIDSEKVDLTIKFKTKGPVTKEQMIEAIDAAELVYQIDDMDKYHAIGLTNEKIVGIKLKPVTVTTQSNPVLASVKQSGYRGMEVPGQNHASMSLWIQSGDEPDSGMYLEIDAMNTDVLEIADADVTTAENAKTTLESVKGALEKVVANRSKIGAQQNRLEHTIKNEENIIENTTASESRIRDTDMAEEMVRFSNAGILEQVGQTMIAQANQNNQMVLSLLQ